MEGVSNKDCYTYTCMSRRFTVYDINGLRSVERFRYRGRVLSYNDNDALTMQRNLKRDRALGGGYLRYSLARRSPRLSPACSTKQC